MLTKEDLHESTGNTFIYAKLELNWSLGSSLFMWPDQIGKSVHVQFFNRRINIDSLYVSKKEGFLKHLGKDQSDIVCR